MYRCWYRSIERFPCRAMPINEFFLSTETPARVAAVRGAPKDRWMAIPHSGIARPAFVLLAGESLRLAEGLQLTRDSRVLVRYGAAHEQISEDGAVLALAIEIEGEARPVAELVIAPGRAGQRVHEAVLDVGAYADAPCQLLLTVGAGAANDPRGDWVAIYELAVAWPEFLPNVRARAFRTERTRNELAHFAHVYEHDIYRNEKGPEAPPASVEADLHCRSLDDLIEGASVARGPGSDLLYPDPEEVPAQLRDAYHYSHHLLTRQLNADPPNFVERLRAIGKDRTPRILSLCSGAARIEASFATASGVDAHWTLMDLSESLLKSAAANFPSHVKPDLIVGDLNRIRDYGQSYDVILCVSGLHHIVELESVLHFVRDALAEDGEFWSIGEAIGRNGNRLWGRDYAAANAFFQQLPGRLRRNRTSGRVDEDLPDTDFSTSTFEGIRSEDIDPMLLRVLEPVHLYRRNCFLWRIVDLAYAENYDLGRQEDVGWLQRAVTAELMHFRSGGRPSELHGVYRRPAL